MIEKNKFKNNSQFIVPKIIQNKRLLDFDIYDIHIHKVGNNIFLCICYNILKRKQMSYLEYLLSIDDNINSYGIEIYNKRVVYFCRFLIPQCYNIFVEICMNTPDLIDTSDILASITYFGAYISK